MAGLTLTLEMAVGRATGGIAGVGSKKAAKNAKAKGNAVAMFFAKKVK
jgi:hypothetical protein